MTLTAKQKLHVEQAGKHLSFGYMLMTLAMGHTSTTANSC